jgi:hypothetical protein
MARPKTPLIAVTLVFLGSTASAQAQELEARKYANAPVGVNFLAIAYGYSSGDIFVDLSLPVEDLDADLNLLALRYTRTLDLRGRSAKLKAMVPVLSGDWSGRDLVSDILRRRDITGFGDARLTLELNVYGAPALRGREFAGYRPRTVAGVSFGVIAPTGKYDPDRLINIGSNRWTFIPEIGVARTIKKWTFEAAATGWFFTDNSDFFGGQRLEQDPVYAVQAHAIYRFGPGFWLAGSAGYASGGRTTVGPVTRDDFQNNVRVGMQLVYALTRSQGLFFGWNSGVTTRTGADFDSYTVGYQYAWGGRGASKRAATDPPRSSPENPPQDP